MKKILILGGTLISCEIVIAAKRMGFYTVVADYNDREKSPAKQIADKEFCISATDVEEIVKLIRDEKIDGVLTGFADVLLESYAEICHKAGLPCYGTKEQFRLFTNKKEYKKICARFGVPVIEEYLETDISKGNIVYPVLVKPVDNSGSRGISICYSLDELYDGINFAKKNSKSRQVLIEPYIEGEECTVFLLFDKGKTYLTAIGNRHVKKIQSGIIPLPVGYTYPASITKNYLENIFPRIKSMMDYVGIKNGMMFLQCKIKDDNCLIYDIGYRLTGSLEYHNLSAVCGYNPLEMLINFAIYGDMNKNNEIELINPFFDNHYAFNVSCLSKSGKIKKIIGVEDVKKMSFVDNVVLAHMPGEEITHEMIGQLSQITVRVLGHSENRQEIFENMKSVHDKLQIISTENEEMILPGISEEDLNGVLI